MTRVYSTASITLPAGNNRVSLQLKATASAIKLWWPNGVGSQTLYSVRASWTAASPTTPLTIPAQSDEVSSVRRLGFRVFALVTVNDTDAATVANNASAEGTGTHGMFFRVNGAAIYSRGAIWFPWKSWKDVWMAARTAYS